MGSSKSKNDREAEREVGDAHGGDVLVDATLVDETLRMTPEERLLLNDRMIRTVTELRNGFGQA